MKGKGTGKGKKSIVRCIIEKMRGGWDAKHRQINSEWGLAGVVVRWCGGARAIAKITKDNAGVATSRRDVAN